eukprot:3382082-Amphidinium_carterae.2
MPQQEDEHSQEHQLAISVASAFLATLYQAMESAELDRFVNLMMRMPAGVVTKATIRTKIITNGIPTNSKL